jgi:hypothetical protein
MASTHNPKHIVDAMAAMSKMKYGPPKFSPSGACSPTPLPNDEIQNGNETDCPTIPITSIAVTATPIIHDRAIGRIRI